MDVGLVQEFLNVPKSEENKTVAEQEQALITKCSEFLALRLHAALQETSKDFSAVAETLSKQPKRDGHLLDQVRAVMQDTPRLLQLLKDAEKEKEKEKKGTPRGGGGKAADVAAARGSRVGPIGKSSVQAGCARKGHAPCRGHPNEAVARWPGQGTRGL